MKSHEILSSQTVQSFWVDVNMCSSLHSVPFTTSSTPPYIILVRLFLKTISLYSIRSQEASPCMKCWIHLFKLDAAELYPTLNHLSWKSCSTTSLCKTPTLLFHDLSHSPKLLYFWLRLQWKRGALIKCWLSVLAVITSRRPNRFVLLDIRLVFGRYFTAFKYLWIIWCLFRLVQSIPTRVSDFIKHFNAQFR